MTSKVRKAWGRFKAWYRNQPEVAVIRPLPKPTQNPEPFELKGEILFSDDTKRVISRQGNSVHVTFPPFWAKFLNGEVMPWLFEAQGKRGLIFVCSEPKGEVAR